MAGGAQPRAHIEPGVMPVFRMLVGLRLGLTALAITAWFFSPAEPILPDLISLLIIAVLLIYLCWSSLQQRLGRWYLPIALTVASMEPIAAIATWTRLSFNRPQIDISSAELVVIGSWQLMTLLLIPLVLIAWQYDFRTVLLFSVVSTLFDVGLTMALLPTDFLSPDVEWLRLHGIKAARFVTFLLAGYIVARLNFAQRQQRNALREANQKLVSYAATVEQLTMSRERNRLARELHDTLAHTLSALSVQLEAVDRTWEVAPEQARQLLGKSLANTRSGLTETRRALQALRASPLEDLGLGLALRSEAEQVATRMGAELFVDLPAENFDLSPNLEQGIYRIAQEALANASQHSAARHLDVALTHRHGWLKLIVRDDGEGFDWDRLDQNGRFGLHGINERARVLGAMLTVDSKIGGGTTIELSMPYNGNYKIEERQ